MHLKNHSDELQEKIVSVIDSLITRQLDKWKPSNQLPSETFKGLCRQLSTVHESVADLWNRDYVMKVMTKVRIFYI